MEIKLNDEKHKNYKWMMMMMMIRIIIATVVTLDGEKIFIPINQNAGIMSSIDSVCFSMVDCIVL